jgi:hypothetical protein
VDASAVNVQFQAPVVTLLHMRDNSMPSRLFVQLGNNPRKNRQAASLNDD